MHILGFEPAALRLYHSARKAIVSEFFWNIGNICIIYTHQINFLNKPYIRFSTLEISL